MRTALQNLESESKQDAHDARWVLAHRIASSSTFARSEQLKKFLLYVCKMTISHRDDEINEQRIGVEVFGRSPDYDPAIDGIVRSHATRLRQRLELYFDGEGSHEPLRIEIPRGGYVPRFCAKTSEEIPLPKLRVSVEKPVEPYIVEPGILPLLSGEETSGKGSRNLPRGVWIRPFLAGLALALLVTVVVLHLRRDAALERQSEIKQTGVEHRFWATLFPEKGRTLIVSGDSGLVLYETVTGREITLTDYLSGAYRDPERTKTDHAIVPSELVSDLASRRYTSFVDLGLASQLSHLPEWSPERTETIFARDLRPSDASSSNLIIIGSRQANPWVSLVEPSMNFILVSQGDAKYHYQNQHPLPGELKEYIPTEDSGSVGGSEVYGEVAYLPNPGGQGMVLVLSGLWMSGTQSAGKFVLSGSQFSDWLTSIARKDGTFPPFELLLRTKNLQGSSTASTILAKRIYGK